MIEDAILEYINSNKVVTIKTIQQAKDKKVKVMFVQKQFETRSTKIVSQEVGAKTIAINPLSHNWSEEMVSIAKKLK